MRFDVLTRILEIGISKSNLSQELVIRETADRF